MARLRLSGVMVRVRDHGVGDIYVHGWPLF